MDKQKSNLDMQICRTLIAIRDTSKNIARNLKRLNQTGGKKSEKSRRKRIVVTGGRIKEMH